MVKSNQAHTPQKKDKHSTIVKDSNELDPTNFLTCIINGRFICNIQCRACERRCHEYSSKLKTKSKLCFKYS